MTSLRVALSSFHQIDLNNNQVISRTMAEGDLEEYVLTLVEKAIRDRQNRVFAIRSETTEVVSQVRRITQSGLTNELFGQCTEVIANRLLQEEVKAQARYQHFTSILKGSLIQALFEYEDDTYFLIAKVEDEEYMERERLIRQLGVPFEEGTLKTCLFKFSESGTIDNIMIGDSNSRLATYWWDGFLELRELNSDEKNTQIAFNAIDHQIAKIVKKESPADYQILKNNLIGYFRTQEDFSFENMISTVIGAYSPVNQNINIDKLKRSLENLPEEKSFDRRFTIKPSVIKARMQRVFHVTDKIELKLTDHIDNLRDTIKSSKTDDGEMYINIKTDKEEIYNMFKRSE